MTDAPSNRTRLLRGTVPPLLVVGSILLTFMASSLTLWLPRRLGSLVDELSSGGLAESALIREVALYLGVALLAASFSKAMRVVPMRWGVGVAHRLRSRLQAHLLSQDESQVRQRRVGELMSRLQSDVNSVADMMALGGHSIIRAVFTLGIAFWMMFSRSPEMAVWMSLLIPLLMIIGFVMLRSIRSRHLQVQEQLGVLTTYCQESFTGLRILRGLGLESLRIRAFADLNQEYIRRNLKLSRVEIPVWPVIQTGFVIGNVLLLWTGGVRVIRGEIPLGVLVEFQQYLMVLQWPSLSVAWSLSLILRGRASYSRLKEVVEEDPQIRDWAGPRNVSDLTHAPLVFDSVSLLMEGTPILREISFRVEAGERIGITGPTGSGKTVLLHTLLRRQDPDRGQIRVGDTPLQEIPLEDLYRHVRIAPQEPMLFSMSLRENLTLADPEVSSDQVDRALDLSALSMDLAQLPDGLDTTIGERGVTLSGGQRQRAAIARALIPDPPVLLLDDSLSAVDTSTESRILEKLLPAMRSRTLLMVSHRVAALRHCDRILVLNEGRLVEQGTPDDLLNAGGYFADLEERQRLQARLEAGDV